MKMVPKEVSRPGVGPSGPSGLSGLGLSEHYFATHLMELPGRARVLSAKPSLSFSVSNIPTNAVKNAAPKMTELSSFGRSPI